MTPADMLRDLQRRIGEANAEKGFHEEGDRLQTMLAVAEGIEAKIPTPEGVNSSSGLFAAALRNYAVARLALITTEVAEAIEEVRNGRAVDETYYVYDDGEDDAPTGFHPDGSPRKPEGVPSELADIVIRAFDFAHEFDIDLAAMIAEKISYNATRGRMHGGKTM